MTKLKNVLMLLMVALMISLSLASCSSTSATGTDEIEAVVAMAQEENPAQTQSADSQAVSDEDQMRAIFGISDEDVDVATYRIRGEARDGESFDWIEVTEPRVVIAGIRRGEWTIYAQALNEDGDVIVSGRLDTFLSSDAPTDNLIFSENDGVGSVSTELRWNPAQVQNPTIEVYVKEDGGEFMARDISEITYVEPGLARWAADSLDAGSYIARFVFKDNGTVIGGTAAALRVITGYTSVGSVDMTVGDMSTPYSIDLGNVPAAVTVGTLNNDGGLISFSSDMDIADLTYEWYINGKLVEGETGAQMDLGDMDLSNGFYRIDLVTNNGKYGSINSFSIVVQLESENVFSTIDIEPVSFVPVASETTATTATTATPAIPAAPATPEVTVFLEEA